MITKQTNKLANLYIIINLDKRKTFYIDYKSIKYFNHKKHIRYIKSINVIHIFNRLF